MIYIPSGRMANPGAKGWTRTLATGQRNNGWLRERRQQRGVTLVELLVVMMIMAMVAGVVIISAPPPIGDLRKTADRFAARLDHAVGYSITSNFPIALEVDANGYLFTQYTDGAWEKSSDKKLQPVMLSPDYWLEMSKPDNDKKIPDTQLSEPKTHIYTFSPTGETDAFNVRFHHDRKYIDVVMNDQGNVEVIANDAR
ncbi:prepilin-type N-terminal cleavage/methylation domain-containing protein [Hyphococcus lacteus]|uniref:Prepilin-type N-terminal cleavage/methylation domain-containing protein n=1 Tax=Hyphococcus lacteus TaxID=3143536 RepID=A0ABV3Z872_9PROT